MPPIRGDPPTSTSPADETVLDLEATGLLRQQSKIHCIVLKDLETSEFHVYDDYANPIDEGIEAGLS